jgi:hypothetical protein
MPTGRVARVGSRERLVGAVATVAAGAGTVRPGAPTGVAWASAEVSPLWDDLSESSLFVVLGTRMTWSRLSAALDESDEPDEPDVSDFVPLLPSSMPRPLNGVGESSVAPVSTSAESEFCVRPATRPQVAQALVPLAARIFSATAICCERLAWSALGA